MENKKRSLQFSSKIRPKTRAKALCISGGGYCGLYSAKSIELIEERLCEGKPIADFMNVISGTSIGGIIAIGLALKIPASRIATCFGENGEGIFKKDSIFGVTKSKYDNKELKETIKEIFGGDNHTVSDLPDDIEIIIPTINTTTGETELFCSSYFKKDYPNTKLIDIAMSTSAAPTYFPLYQHSGGAYADGGLAANNPDSITLAKLLDKGWEPENIEMLCIGTTITEIGIPVPDKLEKGKAFWLTDARIVNTLMRSQESVSQLISKSLLKEKYLWVNETLSAKHSEELGLDKVSESATETLKVLAIDSINKTIEAGQIQAYFTSKKVPFAKILK
jgi:patatin-like phospholipase/acyl hydrolase